MKGWHLGCIIAATVALDATVRIAVLRPGITPPAAIVAGKTSVEPADTAVTVQAAISPNAMVEAAFSLLSRDALASLDATATPSELGAPVLPGAEGPQELPAILSDGAAAAARRELPYLKYYVYSELPEQPAKIALEALSDVPLGMPLEEIRRAAAAFDLDYSFMKAVAKVESNFDPKQRTGSYIGLFQLSEAEFNRYGFGDINNPRDNAVAAAYKFLAEAALFEFATNKKPTLSDLYLIHQQGWQGAAEHISQPGRIAWKSMCATDEGMEKGERWCKHAIWWNTLPPVKREWKSVDNLTSGAFVAMWRDRIETLYARYADAERTKE